jgi:hypothetical protein
VFLPLRPFSNDLRQTVSIEFHQHTDEIRTEILVYEKGGVIKHVEAPAINKVELLNL